VNFEIANITDEPYYTYSNNEKYNTQFEDYGQTYRIGLSYSNF
jgi:outer membrane receptor protein involved in Fe transport